MHADAAVERRCRARPSAICRVGEAGVYLPTARNACGRGRTALARMSASMPCQKAKTQSPMNLSIDAPWWRKDRRGNPHTIRAAGRPPDRAKAARSCWVKPLRSATNSVTSTLAGDRRRLASEIMVLGAQRLGHAAGPRLGSAGRRAPSCRTGRGRRPQHARRRQLDTVHVAAIGAAEIDQPVVHDPSRRIDRVLARDAGIAEAAPSRPRCVRSSVKSSSWNDLVRSTGSFKTAGMRGDPLRAEGIGRRSDLPVRYRSRPWAASYESLRAADRFGRICSSSAMNAPSNVTCS